jgi:hypothetical protein
MENSMEENKQNRDTWNTWNFLVEHNEEVQACKNTQELDCKEPYI